MVITLLSTVQGWGNSGAKSLTSMMVMTRLPVPSCGGSALVSVTLTVRVITATEFLSNISFNVTWPLVGSTENILANLSWSSICCPSLLIAVTGDWTEYTRLFSTLSSSNACSWKMIVPLGVSSGTSALWVGGRKYGSLLFLFMTSIFSLVVPDRLGSPPSTAMMSNS